ncbi:MAG TPA: HNH endonuclease signature motif containing protein [Steroidobacteraceae bacterium]|nr:HNH endonuclease signature motif containing protein [Steroidobacteraceae bacterium]
MDAHHIHHWAQGGETKLSNLVQLCRFHHRQVHEGRVLIMRLDDGGLRFIRPDGRTFESSIPASMKPCPEWRQSPVVNHPHGPDINPRTATTLWRGERMDYDLAIDVLLRKAARGKNVSAETSLECAAQQGFSDFPRPAPAGPSPDWDSETATPRMPETACS